jgi:endonuclease YncB( thermonuclease family)
MFLRAIRIAVLILAGLAMTGAAAAHSEHASDALPGPYLAAVDRVVDGDTLSVRVAVWLDLEVIVLVRIRGVDAPELRGRCESETRRAKAATAALARLVGSGGVVLTEIEGDKYLGRVLADVVTASGQDVGDALLASGHARPYVGGRRGGWCELGADDRPSHFARAE